MKTETADYLDLAKLLTTAATAPEIAVDYETNGKDVRDGRGFTVGASLAFNFPGRGRVSHYMPFRHKHGENLDGEWRERFLDVLRFREQHRLPIVYHNGKADQEFGRSLGHDFKGPWYDTMMMAHLLREERPFSKSLDSCGKFYLSDEGKKESNEFKLIRDKMGWEEIPSYVMFEYAAYDADLTLRLYEKLRPQWDKGAKDGSLDTYWEKKRQTIDILRVMERRGVKIDTELCQRQIAVADACMQEAVELIGKNPGSPKQLAELLVDDLGLPVVKRTKTGAPSFDKDAMEEYDEILERRDSPLAQWILQYRGWQKARSAFYLPYIERLSPDGRLRPNYKPHGTKTGRLSCAEPNLQQIPRVSSKPWNGNTKKAFREDEGWTLWEADYSQLELRLATAYAKEPDLIQVFAEGRDIFEEMAPRIGLVRQDTKTFVYSTQYGAGLTRLRNVFGWSEARAKEIRQGYRDAYPRFHNASTMAQRTAGNLGKVRLWSGRYRHFEFPKEQSHKAFNAIIQGGAADIVESTMRALYNKIDEPGQVEMLLQVHDSVVFRIRDEIADQVVPEIVKTMSDVDGNTGEKFGVKFAVDAHIWGH